MKESFNQIGVDSSSLHPQPARARAPARRPPRTLPRRFLTRFDVFPTAAEFAAAATAIQAFSQQMKVHSDYLQWDRRPSVRPSVRRSVACMLASGCQGAGCARGWQASWPLLMSSKKAAEFVWGTAAAADIRRRAGRDWVSETASKAGTIDACARIREFSDKSGACACACARACVTWTLDFLPPRSFISS